MTNKMLFLFMSLNYIFYNVAIRYHTKLRGYKINNDNHSPLTSLPNHPATKLSAYLECRIFGSDVALLPSWKAA
jgi:hypothetical protein